MPSPIDPADAAFDDQSESTLDAVRGVVRFLHLLRRRKHIVGYFVLAAFAVGLVYYVLAPRKFESVAKLMITVQQSPDQVSSVSEQSHSDTVMASQRELVASAKVIQSAIDQLSPEHRIDLHEEAPRDWVDCIAERLHASTVRKTNLMRVSYQSSHPEAAAAVVEAVIDSYLVFVKKNHRGAAEEVLEGQRQQLGKIEAKLAEKQHRLQQLRSSVEALSASSDQGVVDPVVSEAIHLHEALLELRQQRISLQASQATIEHAIRAGEDVRRHMGLVQEAVGEQVLLSSLGLSPQDAELQVEQQKQLLAAQSELQRISPFLGQGHPRVIALTQQIESTRQYLANYRSSFGNRMLGGTNKEIGALLVDILRQSINRVTAQEQQLNNSYALVFREASRKSSAIDELRQLQREVENLELDRHTYNQKIADVDGHQWVAPLQATIVQDPLPGEKPVSPKLHVALLGATMFGFVLGALVVYVRDLLDDRFGSPDEMAIQLGVPVLSLVRTLTPTGGVGLDAVQMYKGADDVELEAFRTLRTALALGGEVADRLVVSSAEPSDGKTTVSANLAVSFAQVGKRTLVIDADLRRPGMTALMDLKGEPGLTDLLITKDSVDELAERVVRSTDLEGLDIISAGPRRPNPAELLAGKNFADLLAWADGRYDQVLIDCPPVLAVSDAQIVGRLVDGVVVVVSPEKNDRRLVVRASESFTTAGVHLLGVVANRITEKTGAGYGYGYGYGYAYGEDDAELDLAAESSDERSAEEVATLDILPTNWGALGKKPSEGDPPETERRAA